MKTIRNNGFLRGAVWLMFFFSQLYFALTFVNQPLANETQKQPVGQTCYISSPNLSFLADRTKTEKSFSQLLFIYLLFTGAAFLIQKYIPVYRQLCVVYSRLVRIFNLSPCYLIKRVLII